MANSNLVQLIQQIALNAVKTSKPCDYIVGIVVSGNPLKIKVSQTLILEDDFLHLTRNVTDFEIESTLEDKQKITIYNALKTGEKVLMIRKSGGQDFIVIDRVVS